MKIISTVPHFTGALSVLGSGWIIQNVLRNAKRRNSVYHRLLLGASVADLLAASWLMLSSLPEPKGSFYGAIGNQATCNAQGFFIQLSVMSPLYTAAITIYFLLSIRYRYKEFELARLEKWVHPVIWFVGISTATAGIPLKLYNPKVQWCWIASLPRGCVGDGCVRGHNAKYFLVSFAFAWIWMGVLVTTTSLAMLYFTVQRSEMRSSVYQISTVQRRISQVDNNAISRATARVRGQIESASTIPEADELSSTIEVPESQPPLQKILNRALSWSQTLTSRVSIKKSTINSASEGNQRGRVRSRRKLGSSRHVASLATGYVVAFIITTVPATICITIFPWISAVSPLVWLTLVSSTFPLQGFCTFMVYIRPKMEAYFRKRREQGALTSLLPLCCNKTAK